MSKGSKSRITDKKRFDEEYDRIYGAIKRAIKSYQAESSMNLLTRKKIK